MVNWVFWRVEYYSYGLKMSVSTLSHLFRSTARLHKFVDYFNRRSFREFWTFTRKFISWKFWKWQFAKVCLANIFRLSNSRKFIQSKIFDFFLPLLLSIEIGLWKVPKGLPQRNLWVVLRQDFGRVTVWNTFGRYRCQIAVFNLKNFACWLSGWLHNICWR